MGHTTTDQNQQHDGNIRHRLQNKTQNTSGCRIVAVAGAAVPGLGAYGERQRASAHEGVQQGGGEEDGRRPVVATAVAAGGGGGGGQGGGARRQRLEGWPGLPGINSDDDGASK